MGTFAVLAVVIGLVALAVRSMIHDKKNGKSIQCGGECDHCGGHCSH
ncbi:FeoB-associated Cys-rich membrane protein [Lachnospiraceae bacterium 54-53]